MVAVDLVRAAAWDCIVSVLLLLSASELALDEDLQDGCCNTHGCLLAQPRDHDTTMDTIEGRCFYPHGIWQHECNLVFAETLHLQRPGADPALWHVTGTMQLLFCGVASAFEWVRLWSSWKMQQKVETQTVS